MIKRAMDDSTDMIRIRRSFTPEQKVAILREHLLEGVPVSDLCDKHQIQPTLFYNWQKTFFENGEAAFAANSDRGARKAADRQEQQVVALKAKLQKKDEVIAEIMAEHILLKKELGEL